MSRHERADGEMYDLDAQAAVEWVWGGDFAALADRLGLPGEAIRAKLASEPGVARKVDCYLRRLRRVEQLAWIAELDGTRHCRTSAPVNGGAAFCPVWGPADPSLAGTEPVHSRPRGQGGGRGKGKLGDRIRAWAAKHPGEPITPTWAADQWGVSYAYAATVLAALRAEGVPVVVERQPWGTGRTKARRRAA
jgi:hypothetical protein